MKRKRFLSSLWLYFRAFCGGKVGKSDLSLKKWGEDYAALLQDLEKKRGVSLEKLSRIKSQLAKQREQKKCPCKPNPKPNKKLAHLKKEREFLLTKINWESRLPKPFNCAIRRQLQRRYLQHRHPSSGWRTLFFLVAGAVSVSLLLFLPWLLRLLENIGGLKFPQAVPDSALMLLIGVPVFWLIWFFRDRNKILEIQNGRRAASLTEFQKLQERACSKENNLELRLSALQQLRPYLRGEEDNIFLRAAYETLRALLNQLRGTSSTPQKAASATTPQDDTAATTTAPQLHRNEVDCLRQIAQEEWYALLLNHPYSMSHLVLEGVEFLEPLYLPYRNLKHLHAPHARLPRSILYQANLCHAHLEGANLCNAHLEGANLCNAHLEGAYLCYAHLEGARLCNAHLEGAHLEGAHLEGAHLEGAHLEGAHLEWAYLEGAYLEGAYLEGAYLEGAYLEGAYLEGAYLEGANLIGANLIGADLSEADLSEADLSEADLSEADLSEADLSEADLSEADLSEADLSEADLSGADLSGADLSRANLTGTTITPEQWSQAKSWEGCFCDYYPQPPDPTEKSALSAAALTAV